MSLVIILYFKNVFEILKFFRNFFDIIEHDYNRCIRIKIDNNFEFMKINL